MIDFKKLKEPIPFQWKVQTANQHGANCVAYIDSRDVQDRLDAVCGENNWTNRFLDIKGNCYCEIGIRIDNDFIFKSDCGAESNVEKEKGEASDAFKRAAVMWGIGRFLYDLPIIKLPTISNNGKYYVENGGKPVFDKDVINSMCDKVYRRLQNKTNNNLNAVKLQVESCQSIDDLNALYKSLPVTLANDDYLLSFFKDKKTQLNGGHSNNSFAGK